MVHPDFETVLRPGRHLPKSAEDRNSKVEDGKGKIWTGLHILQ